MQRWEPFRNLRFEANLYPLLDHLGVKKYSSTFHAFSSIVEHEGIFALYKGLGASLLRQATYTTTRLGVYTWSLEAFAK